MQRYAEFTHSAADMVALASQLDLITSHTSWAAAVPVLLPLANDTSRYKFGSVEPSSVRVLIEPKLLTQAIDGMLAYRASGCFPDTMSCSSMYV